MFGSQDKLLHIILLTSSLTPSNILKTNQSERFEEGEDIEKEENDKQQPYQPVNIEVDR